MNNLTATLLLGATLSLESTFANPLASEKAELTVSFENLQQLAQSLQKESQPEPESPPVSATIRKAEYLVDLHSPQQALVTARFSVSTFENKWTILPLLSKNIAIQHIEPANTVLTPTKENLSFLTKIAGEHTITARFLCEPTADHSFTFDFLPATSSLVTLEGNPNYKVADAHKVEDLHYILPNSGGTVRITTKSAQDEILKKETSWAADSRVLYSVKNNELHAEARIQLSANPGELANNASLVIPANSRILGVNSPDLAHWKGTHTSNQQNLQLHWQNKGITRRRVTLTYTLPLPDIEEPWVLDLPRLASPLKTRGQLALLTSASYSPRTNSAHPQLSLEQTPEWMKQRGIPYTLKLPKAEEVSFHLTKLKQLMTATATIKAAHFTTQIVSDGSTLTQGALSVSHADPLLWHFQLPPNCEILSCSIGSESTNPVTLDNGMLQLTLPKSINGEETTIQLSFTSNLGKIAPLEGKLSLSLPSTPLFIHALTWDISLPTPYEVTAVDGNLSFRSQNKSSKQLSLIKKLSRNQAAHTDIFYRKNR